MGSPQGTPLPFAVCAYLFVQVAHQLTLERPHGEILPENVLLGPQGEIELAEAGALPTELGDQLGYLAPERIRGAKPEPRSDLFSLSAVFVEALTGVPFHSAKLVNQTAKNPLALVDPDVPTALVPLIRKALSLKAEDRFASVSDMLTAIRPLLPASLLDEGRRALVLSLARAFPAPKTSPTEETAQARPIGREWDEEEAPAPTLTTSEPLAHTRERLGYVEKAPKAEWRFRKRQIIAAVFGLIVSVWGFQFHSFLAPFSQAPSETVNTSQSQPVYSVPGGQCLVELESKPTGAVVRINRAWSGGLTPTVLSLPCQRTALITLRAPDGTTTHQFFVPTQRIETKKYKISKSPFAKTAAWLRLLIAFQTDILTQIHGRK